MNQADTGRFIADRRKEKGLTQAQLAERLNITDRAVSKWETGKSMPDSSIMLELCQILDISVNELLSGEKIEVENASQKADEALLELKRKDENNMSKNTVISVIFTITMFTGIIVGCICDVAITGTLTWSLITLSAIVSLSVFIIPFLYILSILVKNTAVFRIGTPMSVFTLIYMWVVYALYTRFRQRKLLATGVTLFLAIPFMLLVNMTLSKMIAEPMIDIWDILSAFILLVAAFAFMFGDYAHNKGSITY